MDTRHGYDHAVTDTPETERRWLSRLTAATYLDCDPTTVDRLANAGQLTRHRVGGLVRYDARQIDDLFARSAIARAGTRVE